MTRPSPLPMPSPKDALTARIGSAVTVLSVGAERAGPWVLKSLIAPGRPVDFDECDVAAAECLLLLLRALPPQALVQLCATLRESIATLPPHVIDQVLNQIDEARLFAEGLV